ncbi:MAG: hypothetical protein ACKV22_25350 [Bryobacteraceae bacterium]
MFPEPWTPPGNPDLLAGSTRNYRLLQQGERRYVLVGVEEVTPKKFKVLFPGGSRAGRASDEDWNRAVPVEELEVESQLRKYNADRGKPGAKLAEALPWEIRWKTAKGTGIKRGCRDTNHGTFAVEFSDRATGLRKGVIRGTYCGFGNSGYGGGLGEAFLDRTMWACDFNDEWLSFVVLCDMK